jgi:hypothetical protein
MGKRGVAPSLVQGRLCFGVWFASLLASWRRAPRAKRGRWQMPRAWLLHFGPRQVPGYGATGLAHLATGCGTAAPLRARPGWSPFADGRYRGTPRAMGPELTRARMVSSRYRSAWLISPTHLSGACPPPRSTSSQAPSPGNGGQTKDKRGQIHQDKFRGLLWAMVKFWCIWRWLRRARGPPRHAGLPLSPRLHVPHRRVDQQA